MDGRPKRKLLRVFPFQCGRAPDAFLVGGVRSDHTAEAEVAPRLGGSRRSIALIWYSLSLARLGRSRLTSRTRGLTIVSTSTVSERAAKRVFNFNAGPG